MSEDKKKKPFDDRTLDWERRLDLQTLAGLMSSYNEGLRDGYSEVGEEEVVWVTANDEKVCEICGALEGVYFKLEDAEGLLPAHVNCRCVWAAASEYTAER